MHLAGEPVPSSAASNDFALIQRTIRGDQQAYAELVRRYSAIARRCASLITGPADAEDAVQEAFVRAFYALNRFRHGAAFKPWLLAIVMNCARNKPRTASQQPRVWERLLADRAVGPLHVVPSAESAAMTAEQMRILVQAIDALPANARIVIPCRYLRSFPRRRLRRCLAGQPAQ
jgi:RNA polymerase sigma-70 factor (ECF subfamily)